jgi:hypothetical protein
MNDLLKRLFVKRKIEKFDDLDETEKKTYENWQAVLSKEELTLQDVKHFCQYQINIIESKWKDHDIPQSKKAEWIAPHSIYKSLLEAIDSPKAVREALEKNLIQLIEN